MRTKTSIFLTLLVAATFIMPPAAADEEDDPTQGGDSRSKTVCRYEDAPLSTVGYACAHATVAYAIVKCTRNTETKTRTCDVLFTIDLTVEGWASCGSATSQWVPRSAFTCTFLPVPFSQSSTHEEGPHTYTGIPDEGFKTTAEGQVCIDYRSYPVECEDLDLDVIFPPVANAGTGIPQILEYVGNLADALLSNDPLPIGPDDLPIQE